MCKLEPTAHYDTSKLAKDEQWIEKFNPAVLAADIKRLGDELEKNQGEEDVCHFCKMVLWSNMCGIIGFVTMGFGVSPVAIIVLSTF
eukprot:13610459-Ditylum_brightwellii.AAC.1